MRIAWMVMLLGTLTVGCDRAHFVGPIDIDKPIDGCQLVDTSTSKELKPIAANYFTREAGVRIVSMQIGAMSNCGGMYYVSIWAVTDSIRTPREWEVEIDPNNHSVLRLKRPE